MVDPEGTAGPDNAGAAGGGVSGFLSSGRNLIATFATLIGAISGLILALNKAGIIGDDGDDSSGGTVTAPTNTEPKSGERLFRETTVLAGRVYFDGEAMYVKSGKARNAFVAVAERDEGLQDVALSARTSWISGSRDYGVGFVCRYENPNNYYFASVLSKGEYHIAKYRRGKLVSLTRGPQRSAVVDADANDVTARCVGDDPTIITLDVNGRRVASARDEDGIASGNVGVRVGSGEAVVTARFDGLELRYL